LPHPDSGTTPSFSSSDTPPQLISTSASEFGTSSSPERKLFYSSGYWWVFWEENSDNFVFSSSPDEITWSLPTVVASGLSNACECASVWVNAGTVYYAQSTGLQNFTYNTGALNAGGTITWSTPTTVATKYNTQDSISIITDALGNPWVAVYTESGSAGATPQYVEVYEHTGGAWSAAANSPIAGQNFGGPEYLAGWVQMVPLPELSPTLPGVAVLYAFVDCTLCFSGVSLEYTYLSGGALAWSSAVSAGASYAEFSATAVGDTIYIAGSNGFGTSGSGGLGGVEFSSYTVGAPTASSPVLIAPGASWGSFPPTPGTDVSISQGAAGSGTLIIFYEDQLGFNLDYSISANLGATWGTTQSMYPSPQTIVSAVSSVDSATPGNEFGVVFTNYAGSFDLEFASVTVSSLASPTIATTPSATSATLGVTLKDTANLAGGTSPTGTITFTLFAPGGSTPVDTETVTVTGNGAYTTPVGFFPTAAGTWQWDATYSGDANNNAATENGATSEQVTVSSSTTYSATFQQTGIPTSGVTWGVTVGTTHYTGTGGSIIVPGLGGTVSYSYDSPVSSTAGTRYVCPTGCSGSVSGATTVTGTYGTQFLVIFGYTTSDGSPITSGVNIGYYEQFGAKSGAINSGASYGATSPSSDWVDAGGYVVYTSYTASSSTERWSPSAPGGYQYLVASSISLVQLFYHQFLITFGYTDQDASTITPGHALGYYDQFGPQVPIFSGSSYGTTSPTSAWVDAGTGTLLYFSPSPTATVRWVLPPPFTTTFESYDVTASTAIQSAYFHQFLVTFGYTTNDASAITAGHALGYYDQFGSYNVAEIGSGVINSGATYGTTTPSSDWVDAGGYVVYTSYTASSSTERWSPSVGGGYQYLIGSSGPRVPLFYHQYELTLSYSTSDGTALFGSPTVTFTAAQFGSATATALTTSPATVWYDASSTGTAYTVTPTTVTGGSGDLYQLAAGTNQGSITSASTYNFEYFHTLSPQVSVAITLTPSPGTISPIGATNYFSVTYTSGGTVSTVSQVGGTLDLKVDASTTVTVAATSSGSGATEEWCLTYCGPDQFSSGASGTSVTLTYYQQYLEQVSYKTSGGVPPSNWCPVYPTMPCNENFFYSSAGLPLSVPLTTTPTSEFIDVGSTWHVVDPAFGSTASEGWFATPSTSSITSGPATASAGTISGTVSAIGSVALVYYHEYSVQARYSTSDSTTISTTITLDGTQSGAAVQIALLTLALPYWLDAGSSWTATPSTATISSTEQYALVSGGSGSVGGPGLSANPLYQHQYLVTFAFSGTPQAGQSIQVNGATISPGSLWEDAGATISISLTSGTGFLNWVTSSPSIVLGTASSVSTTAVINGAGTLTAALNPSYPVTFTESGLPAGASWTVTLNGVSASSTTGEITFSEQNGAAYKYTIPCFEELCPTIASGAVTVDIGGATGLPLVYVQFYGAWPSYLHDSQQTAQSPYVAAQAATLEWTFLAGDALLSAGVVCPLPTIPPTPVECLGVSAVSTPAIGPDGTIYFGDFGASGSTMGTTNLYAGNLFALNPDGSLKWVFDTQGSVGGAPAIGPDGTIYIGTSEALFSTGAVGQNSILAVNPDGTLKWKVSLPSASSGLASTDGAGQLSFEIAPGGGVIYAVAGADLYALSTTGLIEWQVTLGTPFYFGFGIYSEAILSSPVVGPSGAIYVIGSVPGPNCVPVELASCTQDYSLYSVSPGGAINWQVALDDPAYQSGPAVDSNGIIYTACGAASICAYNPDSSLKWMVALPTTSCTTAEQAFGDATTPCTYQVLPTTTLVIGPGGTLLVPTEQLATTSGQNAYGPTTDVYYGPYIFYALNSADGSIGWSVNTYDPVNSPAIGADGTIYLPSMSGDVYAYSSTGTELWDYSGLYATGSLGIGPLGPTYVIGSLSMDTSPAIGKDGTVYVGDSYGHLFAIGPGPTATLPLVSKLTFVLHSPINILITLPNGEQAGFNAAGTLVNTAGAIVTPPDPATGQLETINLNDPGQGQYEMQIFGTGTGPFTVTVQSLGPDGGVLGSTSFSGTATLGSEQTTYLGLVGGGQMSMLLNLGLSNPILTLGCTPSSIQVGGTANCTATLLDTTGSIIGENIVFSHAKDSGGVNFPSPTVCTIIAGDSCSVVVTGTNIGTSTIQASYAGDTSNGAASTTTALAITSAQTSTAVACSPSPVTVGSLSTCTAKVSGAYGSTAGETVSFTASGSGTFSSGGACTLSGGSCSLTYTPTSVSGSPQTITTVYSGDTNNAGSSGTASLAVSQAPTTTSVSCTSPVTVGTQATCTITVTGYGTPTGTVDSLTSTGAGSFDAASCTLSGGTCSVHYTPTSASGSPHLISATYEGDTNNAPSTATGAGSGSVAVNRAASTTALSCASPVAVGTASLCTVTLTGYGTPSGTASFAASGSGTFDQASCALSSGSCSVNYTPTSVSGSPQTVTATYAGDTNDVGSSTSTTVTVNKATTTTTVSCTPASFLVGATSSCIATVTGYSPSGTIAFSQSSSDGGSATISSSTCSLSGGTCSVTATGASAGTVKIQGAYSGDSSNTASSGNYNVAVQSPAEATQQLISTLNGMNLPNDITNSLDAKLNAALDSINHGDGIAAINQLDAFINEVQAQAGKAIPQSQAQLLTSDAQSIISSLSYVTSTALRCNPSTVFVGATTHCEADVTTAGSALLTGSVAFTSSDAHGSFGKATCNSNGDNNGGGGSLTCRVDYSFSSAGTETLTAAYSGDAHHSSTLAALQLTVTLIPTNTSLKCDPSKADAGKTTPCEADVSSQDGGLPSGSVTFTSSDALGTFGKVTCSAGRGNNEGQSNVLVCQVDYTPSTSGAHATITATYPGDPSHSSSNATFKLNGDKRR